MSDEEIIYDGTYVKLKELHINGQVYEKAYIRSAVIIFAIKQDGSILMINENRPHENFGPVNRIKPVTGFIDDGDDWKITAHKELQEEIGLDAKKITLLKKISNRGNINVCRYFAIATDLFESKVTNPDGEDSIIDILPMRLQDIIDKSYNESIPSTFDTFGFYILKEALTSGKISLEEPVLD